MEIIKIGHIPQAMEDKWFMYYENSKLFIHRSWTGAFAYQVEFERPESNYIVKTILFNKLIYKSPDYIVDLHYELKLVEYLLKRILLRSIDIGLPANPSTSTNNNC